MIRYENDCVDCAVPGYPCLGTACPRTRTPHYYCDWCEEEHDKIYEYEDNQVCIGCIEKDLIEVKG